jgi:cysteine-S-conjugate beta-lyase
MRVSSDSIDQLRHRTSTKWTEYPPDVLPLFVAEMDYPLAAPIKQALIELVERSDTGYLGADPPVRRAFARFAARRWGWSVDPDRVHPTADVSMGIVEVLRRVIRPGDEVVIMPPIYPPFFDLVPEAGGLVREVALTLSPTGWSMDLEGLERALAGGARAILLCNPHNPLGHPHPADELAAVAELAARFGAIVVADEIHGPLVHTDGVYTPFLTVSDAAREHGIAITSASKGWNLAGLKCALMIAASDRMHQVLTGMWEEVTYRTSLFGAHASAAAFDHAEDWLDGAIAAIEDNRRLLGDLLAEHLPEVGYREPLASYLAWLDLRALGWGDDPAAVILERSRVALVPGQTFGSVGRGFARLNLACSPELLTEAVTRIAAAR